MERKGNVQRKKKRTRDEGDDQKKEYCHKGKKQELIITCSDKDSSSYRELKGNEFHDPIGVFDFPWLKEGSIFEVDEFLGPEDNVFAPCCCVYEEDTLVANLDQPSLQNSLALDQNFDGDSLCSFRVDDFEPLDCIWSSIDDQPFVNVYPNKA